MNHRMPPDCMDSTGRLHILRKPTKNEMKRGIWTSGARKLWNTEKNSEWSSSSYFLHRKNVDSLDCFHLQISQQYCLTQPCFATLDFIMTDMFSMSSFAHERSPLRNLIVPVNGIFGKLTKTFWVQQRINHYLLIYTYCSNILDNGLATIECCKVSIQHQELYNVANPKL